MSQRPHFLQRRCTYTYDRWPWATCAFFIACVCTFYGTDSLQPYRRNDPSRWFAPFVYAFFHIDSFHLWSNMIILLFGGVAMEATETTLRVFLTIMISIPLSAAGQGFASDRGVVGASGFVYAILVYQVALVLKNCREMRVRSNHREWYIVLRSVLSSAYTRLAFGILLLIAEIIVSQYSTNVSSAGHALGAVAGLFAGMAIGTNVVIDVAELIIPLVGWCGLFGLVIAALSTSQYAAALWTWPFVLATLPILSHEIQKWSKHYKLHVYPRLYAVRYG